MGDTSSDETDQETMQDGDKSSRSLPLPSTNPATNLLIADVLVRGASTLLRKKIDERVVKDSAVSDSEAQDILDGRGIITTLGLYGASKLATRSFPGLAVVAGGLVLKTLYDRGKSRQKRLANGNGHEISGDEV